MTPEQALQIITEVLRRAPVTTGELFALNTAIQTINAAVKSITAPANKPKEEKQKAA